MNKLDDFVDQLQEKIFTEAKEALGDKGFERWLNPKYRGRMERPDGQSRVTGSCGDTMEIFLKFQQGKVCDASYVTDGCASSSICGSFASELSLGRSPDALTDITGETVLATIGRLPEEDRHCADLAAAAVQEALSNYMKRNKPS